MKVKELVDLLKGFDGNTDASVSDKKGIFSNIDGVEMQRWLCEGKEHESVTLVLGAYKKDDSIKDDDISIEVEVDEDNPKDILGKLLRQRLEEYDENSKFIDNVNNELGDGDEIDKEEALEAKKVFDKDKKNCKENKTPGYITTEEELKVKIKKYFDRVFNLVITELFENNTPLENRTIGDLKYFIYKNSWQNEFNIKNINNRPEVLNFLYRKLEEAILDKIATTFKGEGHKTEEPKDGFVMVDFSDIDRLFNKPWWPNIF